MSVGLSGLHGKQLIHPDIRFGQSLAFVVRRAGQEPRLKGFGDNWQGSTGFRLFLESPRFAAFCFSIGRDVTL